MVRRSFHAQLGLGSVPSAHLATVAVEAALNRDLTQLREVRLLRTQSKSPTVSPAPASVAAISQVRVEDIEQMPSESIDKFYSLPSVASHPCVLATARRGGKVHARSSKRVRCLFGD